MQELTLQTHLQQATNEDLKALFSFKSTDSIDRIILKFNLFGRKLFPRYFESEDAPFHALIDYYNVASYLGLIKSFTDIGFRGCAKTTRTKLFLAFCISNDLDHSRKYLKILAEDGNNSAQSVTDIYNLLIDPTMLVLYSEIFAKTTTKREERMDVFTTATGIKLLADTVGSAQRGQVQDVTRPDLVWFDDFETVGTIKSAVRTVAIWDNMDEARNGLAKGGSCIYTCNYISERGNVHKLVEKADEKNIVLIIPIMTPDTVPISKEAVPTWNRFTMEDIEGFYKDAKDFAGDYLSKPSAGKDVMFEREKIDKMPKRDPIKEVGGFRTFFKYDPSHRYGAGADVAGGVGLDSSTSVFIDFSTMPAQVVASFDDNEIKPDTFGDELDKEGSSFGQCIIAPENNKYDMCIGRLKQIYPREKIYRSQPKESKVDKDGVEQKGDYGWNTNGLTKSTMIFALVKAVNDGLLELNDKKLIAEARKYSRNDLMDAEIDARLTTRHFDLLIASAIAWQMKDFATVKKVPKTEREQERQSQYSDIGL